MTVILNHSLIDIAATATVADLLVQQDMAGDGVAVAVNNKVVPRSQWGLVCLSQGDNVTVIRAVCGG